MLRLSLRQQPEVPLELDGVTPCRVANLSLQEVTKLPIYHGNRTVELGEFFDVTGNPDSGEILFQGDCSRVKLIGSKMTRGRIVVEGHVGMHAGAQMTGGELAIRGNTAEWLGAEMAGGTIRVMGDVGDQCGAGYRGCRHGMRGGQIFVTGNCGDEAGLLMRRGLIVVEGSVGDYAAAAMIAGTLVAFGQMGKACADGMKRGTVLLREPPANLPPGFRYSCDYAPSYVGLLVKYLREQHIESAKHLDVKTVACHRGDILHGGRGEVLICQSEQ
jgi:formylmethanofuran dehydrogenase subunit C